MWGEGEYLDLESIDCTLISDSLLENIIKTHILLKKIAFLQLKTFFLALKQYNTRHCCRASAAGSDF